MLLVMKVQIVGVAETGPPASSGAGNETTVVTWWRATEAGAARQGGRGLNWLD